MGNKKQIQAYLYIGLTNSPWRANVRRIIKYSREMRFPQLNEFKLITAPDEDILKQKVNVQIAKWKAFKINPKRRLRKSRIFIRS